MTLTARRLAVTFASAALVFAAVCAGALCVGSTVDFGWPTLAGRIELVALAALTGLALGAAGACYQIILRNDLADPYLLGIASGAALTSYVWRLPAFAAAIASLGPIVAAAGQQSFTFVGALAAAAIVLGVSGIRGRFDPATLVLVGVTLSTICGALILLLFTLVGSLPGSGSVQSLFIGAIRTSLTRAEIVTSATLILTGIAVMIARARRLNVAALSDDEARSLGIAPGRERLIGLAAASLTTAAAVAIAGPVGFVGLIAPHVVRRTFGSDARVMLPLSAAAGAMLVVVADAVLRLLAGEAFVNKVIPLGVATALLGGPFFLVLIAGRDRERA